MPAGEPTARRGLITVTGATGRQGGVVARRLLADGWAVRGLTRNADSKKARRLGNVGVKSSRVT